MEQENFRMVLQEVGQTIIPQNTRASLLVTQVAGTILERNKLGVIVDRNAPPTSNSVVPEWQVFVVDEPKIKNAFVIPGGRHLEISHSRTWYLTHSARPEDIRFLWNV